MKNVRLSSLVVSCKDYKPAYNWYLRRSDGYYYGTANHVDDMTYDEETLREYYHLSGLPLKRFFNTSGIPYREMGLSKKLPEMSEDEQLALLATDGMLVKRPLVVGDGFVLTGFKEEEWSAKLK